MADYEAWITSNITTIQHWYKLNDVGTTATDASNTGDANSLGETGAGSLTWQTQGPNLGGQDDDALSFDGTNYLTDVSLPVGYADHSVSTGGFIWVWKQDDIGTNQNCFWKYGHPSDTNNGCYMRYQGVNNYFFFLMGEGSNNISLQFQAGDSATTIMGDGRWHSIIVEQPGDGTGLRAWYDGQDATAFATWGGNTTGTGTDDADSWWQDHSGIPSSEMQIGRWRTSPTDLLEGDVATFVWYHGVEFNDTLAAAFHEEIYPPSGTRHERRRVYPLLP